MKIIYEKAINSDEGTRFIKCEQEDATHIHYCYNDETPTKPCKRVKI